MGGTVHIIGAGVAGLASAVGAIRHGQKVILYEATKRAGGRCRSFYDPNLESTLDNGSHVVLAGNPSVFEYLSRIGSRDELILVNDNGRIPFADCETGAQWNIRPNTGRIPWFLLSSSRRPPQTELRNYLKALRLPWSGRHESVSDILSDTGAAWSTFWEPLSTAIMNTAPDQASARLLGAALKRGFTSAGGGIRTYVPRVSLTDTFVEPALKYLEKSGVAIELNSPLVSVKGRSRAEQLVFRSRTVDIDQRDSVVLALPPWSPALERFLPNGFEPTPSPIINVHFAIPEECEIQPNTMTGVINGQAHWIFTQDKTISVTVSADQTLADLKQEETAQRIWHDVQRSFGWDSINCPPYRVIVERRATPIQDGNFERSRPGMETSLANLLLAGDWVQTGLPCTLESAVLSGFQAVRAAVSRD